MFDAIKGLVEQKLQNADPKAVSDATASTVGAMPPQEVAQHAQTAVGALNDQGQPDLAKELGDIVQTAQTNPDALKRGVIGFIERNPQTLASFAPAVSQSILGKL